MKTMMNGTNGIHNRMNGTLKAPLSSEPSKPLGDGGGGRDSGGKFTAGNRLGRGNPHARKVAALRTALLNGVTEEKLTKMVARLLEMATAGNIAAAKLILSYTIGLPTPTVDPDRLDIDEFHLLDESPTKTEILRASLDGVSPAAAVRIAQEGKQPASMVEIIVGDEAVPGGETGSTQQAAARISNFEKVMGRYLDEQKRRVEKK